MIIANWAIFGVIEVGIYGRFWSWFNNTCYEAIKFYYKPPEGLLLYDVSFKINHVNGILQNESITKNEKDYYYYVDLIHDTTYWISSSIDIEFKVYQKFK